MHGISAPVHATVVTRKHFPLRLHQLIYSICAFVSTELHKPGAYLFPVRVFLAVGWLRTFVEKLLDPWWLNGTKLTAFLTYQASPHHRPPPHLCPTSSPYEPPVLHPLPQWVRHTNRATS